MSGPLGSSQWMYATGAEVTQQSLKFNDDESQYLSWTPASAGNRKTWTWSGWVKRGNVDVTTSLFGSGPDSDNQCFMIFAASGVIQFRNEVSNSIKIVQSTALFRDPSAFYHIVAVYDSSNATSADRMRLYVNGERITDFSNEVQPSLNLDSFMNSSSYEMFIGKQRSDSTSYFDGLLSNIHFIDGQALDASSFGQFTNGYWEAKDYAGSYGTNTNGFHLTFQDDVVSEGFNAVTYRGTGADQSISGLGFEPDFVWVKVRNNPNNHRLFDSVRGASSDLISNSTSAESITSTRLVSFDTDGFTVGSNAEVNGNGYSHVGWAWDAGSGSPVSNTDGTITSTVKANPAYGFSIVSYTGTGSSTTTGHGLNSAPELVIIKDRDSAQDWNVYHVDVGTTNILALNSTSAAYADGAAMINSTAPTSSVVHIGFGGASNGSGRDYIAYAFHSVAGYSSISSYSGTGADHSSEQTLGFRPAFVLVKDSTSGGDPWVIFDNTRDTDGTLNNLLFPNSSGAEVSSSVTKLEISDTGFTVKGTGTAHNKNGSTIIYMAVADTREAAFWKDTSGQGNHWTPNNLDYRDSVVDSAANNFAVFNALVTTHNLSEGNLRVDCDNGTAAIPSTILAESGKLYSEILINDLAGSNTYVRIGVVTADGIGKDLGGVTGTFAFLGDGRTYSQGSVATYGTAVSTGDVFQVALDNDNGKLWFGINGTWMASGNPASGSNPSLTFTAGEQMGFAVASGSGGFSPDFTANFGQDSTFSGAKPMGAYTDDNSIGNFQYAPPAGYLALCTANLPTPSIVDGSEHFNTVTYTGTGSSNSITVGFQPDFTWIKSRSNSYNHQLVNSVVGYPDGTLLSDATDAEYTAASRVDSRDSNGFTVSSPAQVNLNGGTFAAWNWKAGGTAVSNTAGSITSQVSANTDAGFSIATFTAPTSGTCTVGHGLDVAPECFFIKSRANAYGWTFYHKSIGADKYLALNSTSGQATDSNTWNNTAPTSSVFTLGTNFQNTSTWVGYCFANSDIIKVGSYVGNGSADGPYIHLNFRASWIMIKKSSAGGDNWTIYDTARDPDNVTREYLIPNSSQAAASTDTYDILSNGFKIRTSGAWVNTSGATYIYLAIGSTPFKHSTAR